jgi:hypothetical protein
MKRIFLRLVRAPQSLAPTPGKKIISLRGNFPFSFSSFSCALPTLIFLLLPLGLFGIIF